VARGARERTPGRVALRSFQLGLVTGGAAFAGTLYWTADVMVTFGNLPRPLAMPVSLLLVAYLALYPAIVSLCLGVWVRRWGLAVLWAAPAAWVALEYARGTWLTGFPWVLLGYSQATVLPVAQWASVFGVYGLSALVVFVNVALAQAALDLGPGRWKAPLAAVATVGLIAAWGQVRIMDGRLTREGVLLRVGIVQGNVPQGQKWDPAFGSRILHTYLDLTREVAGRGAQFVVWPESATPFLFEEEPAGRQAVQEVARETGAWLLFGSDQIERGSPPHFYNAAFLVAPDGRQVAAYRKMQLVPFGEYVPLRNLLFFVAPLVESVADFAPGTEQTLLPVAGRPVSTAICYEVVFPSLARSAVARGSQLLTTITNDAWYGHSSAPHQHFEQASLRAIEQGRYLVRAANTGVSGIVNPYGRVIARSALFETASLDGEVRLLEGRTVYSRIGDVLVWASFGICAWIALASIRRTSRRS
jgi:apolipoprotein N-acyltransferase